MFQITRACTSVEWQNIIKYLRSFDIKEMFSISVKLPSAYDQAIVISLVIFESKSKTFILAAYNITVRQTTSSAN
jgi:hypothetical protein